MTEWIMKEDIDMDGERYIKKCKLIRCGECKYSKPIDSEWLECQHDKRVMKPSGYCSWSDPKEKINE